MQLRQYPLIILATTLLITLTGKSGFAFTITPRPQPGQFGEEKLGMSKFTTALDGVGNMITITIPIVNREVLV